MNRVRNRLQAGGTIERKGGSDSIQHLSRVAMDAMHDIVQTAQQTEAVHPLPKSVTTSSKRLVR